MKRVLLLLAALSVPFAAFAIDGDISFDSPEQEARYERLTKELRCVVCQNQNIADSNADLAKDLRGQVLEMLKAGQTDEQILEFMTARYGDFVLYRPPLKPTTWLLWGAPMILLLAGILGTVLVISRRSREAAEGEPEQVAGENS